MKNNTNKGSRTKNSFLNFITSMGGQVLTIVMQFVVRTAFIATLGKSYLGITGLFSNVLSMLSLVELGVGNAILFKLYEPIAKNDNHRISVLMRFYKEIYLVIGCIVAVIGICMIPFLPILIKDYEKVSELGIPIVLIFLLYLFESVSTYLFFAYKSAIVRANQKGYLLTIREYAVTVVSSIVQFALLIVFGNFILYVLVLVMTTILKNLIYARLADKLYPNIDYNIDEKLDKQETTGIAKDCGALFLYRINGVVLKSTDNLVLSAIKGLGAVALYSNYYIFFRTIKSLVVKVFGSFAHSLGNLHTGHDVKHEYHVFEVVMLVTAILGGTGCVGISVVADDFIRVWIGEDWVLDQPFAILMGLEIFTLSMREALGKYRTSMGLFRQAKFRPLFGMLINLVLSIVLVDVMGISGVLLGTIVADWTTFMWYDPIIIHKHGFLNQFPVSTYFWKVLKYVMIIAAVGSLDMWICSRISMGFGWMSIMVQVLICGVSVPTILIMLTAGTSEGKYLLDMVKKALNKVVGRILKHIHN